MGKFRETLAEGAEGALHLGLEQDRVFADLTPEENKRFKAILLQDRQNRGQGNNAKEVVAAGNRGFQNRVGNANSSQAKPVKCYNCSGIGHIARQRTHLKRSQNSEYFKDKMLLMQAHENGVTIFMANLSLADLIYDEASPSYDIPSEATQCVSANEQNKVVNESLTAELARYKEQVEIYEKGNV
nr:retrovirus-related Pol polyprotein from transposon TNT 1-94 [Tanacetum cinerariifolium]